MSALNDTHPPAPMPSAATISRRLAAAVRSSRKSVSQLSEQTGIPRSTLTRRLQRPDRLYVGELNQICDALDVDIVAIFRYDPWAHADALDISVTVRPLRSAHGLWLPERRAILISDSVHQWGVDAILAHELAHAILGHTETSPEAEFFANRLAMRWMTTSTAAIQTLDAGGKISTHETKKAGFTSRMLRDFITPLAPADESEASSTAAAEAGLGNGRRTDRRLNPDDVGNADIIGSMGQRDDSVANAER